MSGSEDKVELNQSLKINGKLKKYGQNKGKLWDTLKRSNVQIMGIEKKRRMP